MLTIAKLGQWSVSYYVDTAREATAAARDDRARNGGLGEYYSESETRLPTWLVAGEDAQRAAELVGLTRVEAAGGSADLDVVTRWLDDGMAPSGEVGRALRTGSVHGFDLTFCAPKSVSLLRARGDDVAIKAVADAHAHAMREAMSYLGAHAGYTRVHNPHTGRKDLVRLPGLVAAAFQHETSRAGDPHLHTHVIVPNRQARADGRLVSLDGTSLFHEARAAGMIYQATLRAELSASLGVEWGRIDPDTGMAEVAGVDRATIRAWSQRASQLREWARGNLVLADEQPSAAQLGVAQKATRPRKPEGLSWAALRAEWAADARGFDVDAEAQRQARQLRRAAGVDVREVARQAVAGIHTAATFTRADLIEAIAAALPVDAAATAGVCPRELMETLADEVLIPVTAQRAPHQREGSVRYTAAELLVEERAIIDLTPARSARAVIPIRRDDTAALSPDQRAAITNIAASPWLIQPLAAPAGAGKTHSLKALRAAMRRTGGDVLVLAPTHRAVDQAMSEDAGGAGMTIAAALERHRRGTLRLGPETLVVVDEAGMVGTQQLRELLGATAEASVKTVLVGDARQLEPVKARAGTFEQLCTDLPWAQHLSEVWRMRDPDERAASLAVRHGGAAAVRRAVGWYRRHERLRSGDEVTMADDALAAWRADLDAGLDALLIADRWEVADPLNERIHRDRIAADAPTVTAARGHRIAAGDLIVTRDSDPTIAMRPARAGQPDPAPVRNGNRWEVLEVDPDNNRLAARRIGDHAIAVFSGDFLREQVHLGYVLTVHAAQGATADTTHALLGVASRLANRRTAYVAITRGRHTNTVYLYEQPTGERDHEHAPTTDTDTHTRVRGTTAQAAAALRTILGRDRDSATIAETAAAAAEHTQLPAEVTNHLDYHRRVVTDLRRAHRARHTKAAVDNRQHRRTQTADKALADILAVAGRHGGDPLPAGPLAVPYTHAVTTAHSRNRKDLDQLITDTHAAAAAQDRAALVVSPTPQPPHTAERGWKQAPYNPQRLTTTPMPRNATLIIDNAAQAQPEDLARLAAHAATHHARLLLVDDDQPGPSRRLLDGLNLPWAAHHHDIDPAARAAALTIADPELAADIERSRDTHQRAWHQLTRITERHRGRDHTRDLDRDDYGLDI
ncbi:relaxase domain-containing protein [Mycolicibacterium goodii]|uniref:MobF family relaxase n=1 Tax=Mycolicibacterium goodii TaxID=134601 RepID=UPI001BDD243A|nr:MobF family relaxase [Mycolicibacterium goodii]MBU8820679.1 relaxase domain-containing protein [Mycolicibacterium goodii]